VPGQAAGVEPGGIGGGEKLRHEAWHAAGCQLAMTFAGQNQVPVTRESRSGAFGGGGRRHRISLARQ
jgi:hypothetical protein